MSVNINGDTGVSKVQDGTIEQADLAANVVGNGPAFRATSNASQPLTNTVATKVLFQTESFDTNGCLLNSTFTAPVSGYYFIEATVGYGNTTANLFFVTVRVNGTAVRSVRGLTNTTFALTTSIADTMQLNAGDTVEIWATQYSGGTLNIITPDTFFSGYLVRAGA